MYRFYTQCQEYNTSLSEQTEQNENTRHAKESGYMPMVKFTTKARFHVAVNTQINKFVFYFIVRRNVKFGCSKC